MLYLSTEGSAPPATLAEAIHRGLAPDGGLYLPERLDPLPPDFLATIRERSLVEIGEMVSRPWIGDALSSRELRGLLEDALDFPIPLVQLEESTWVLELFRGPTLAFKDVGARFLARLLPHVLGGEPLTVLVATSGDTGSAVAQAFHGVDGTRVVVLYPRGKVSPLQERQFTTLGDNVRAFAVEGSFDDCQGLAKAAFRDPVIRREVRLTSANSINVGRLLPQVFYYLHAWAQLPAGSPPPLFSTPSGNFGNLTAGLVAERIGLPCAGFVAATNVNDVVPAYLRTGRYEPRRAVPTISNAMDVGDPSNFARLLGLFGGDRSALLERVQGRRYDDDATRRCIADVHGRLGRLLDPHTAVGYLGLGDALAGARDVPGIVLATAHPAKFREVVEEVIGEPVELPERLARCLERPDRSERMPNELGALRDALS